MNLRDVDRTLQVIMWFYQHQLLFDMIDEKSKENLKKQTQYEEEMEEDEIQHYEVSRNLRKPQSTETALVHLYNEMVLAVDNGEVGALVLLDMSAAFDTIDHGIMLDVLRRRFNVQDAALDWFNSYFTDRTQIVVSGTDSSAVRELKVGTPQGAVLGPRSFIVYAEDATDIFLRRRVSAIISLLMICRVPNTPSCHKSARWLLSSEAVCPK